MPTFVMLKRGDVSEELISHHPNAFLLLTLIALRARRTPNIIRNLDVCECHIGDFDACGLTRQQYRTAQKILENFNLATFNPTNKGTIAKLINTDIYDINVDDSNQQANHQATIKQPASNQPPNHQATTNNNVNNLNKEKNEKNVKKSTPEIENFVRTYQEYVSKAFGKLAPKITDSFISKCCKTITQLIEIDNFTFTEIFDSIKWASNDAFWGTQLKSLANVRTNGKNGGKKFVNMFTAYENKDVKSPNKAEERLQANLQAGEDFVNGFK